jgi:hypothetical protein
MTKPKMAGALMVAQQDLPNRTTVCAYRLPDGQGLVEVVRSAGGGKTRHLWMSEDDVAKVVDDGWELLDFLRRAAKDEPAFGLDAGEVSGVVAAVAGAARALRERPAEEPTA